MTKSIDKIGRRLIICFLGLIIWVILTLSQQKLIAQSPSSLLIGLYEINFEFLRVNLAGTLLPLIISTTSIYYYIIHEMKKSLRNIGIAFVVIFLLEFFEILMNPDRFWNVGLGGFIVLVAILLSVFLLDSTDGFKKTLFKMSTLILFPVIIIDFLTAFYVNLSSGNNARVVGGAGLLDGLMIVMTLIIFVSIAWWLFNLKGNG